MSKVLHIRDVPDDVHDALVQAAEAQGLSLTKFMQQQLRHVAMRARLVDHNAEVVLQTQARTGSPADRETILAVLHEGRGD